ncbi:MAG: DNA topoisomerase IB [Actinomycetota bacterium]|nr:DNA topoisomerase IB [Actinomycetota bacterium]
MAPRLRRADCSAPGIRRRRAGRGFVYFDPSGTRVTDPDVLDRVRALVIPPAWTDVWICTDARGHIQATGVDARGRRQYRYHDVWRERRDREKFDHMLEFARALPKLRHYAKEHLAEEELTRNRVLACAARLLDLGFFRIGTEGYAEENQTYGLATIHKRHVKLEPPSTVNFDYLAKGGKRRIQSVVDPEVYVVVEALKRRRGGTPELLAWHRGQEWVDVRSADINQYIKEVTGGDFSAKDFRTWNATVLAAMALAVSTGAASPTARKRAVARAMKEVAHYLGNTPAVCRSSYVDPRIVDRYLAGATIAPALEQALVEAPADPAEAGTLLTQGPIEEAVLDLLEENDTGRVELAS